MAHSPSPVGAALRGRCPCCGQGRLFRRYLEVEPRCDSCGLDLTQVDSGDGPAVFVILIGGALIMIGVVLVEVRFHPPYWVHALIWIPAITLLSIGLIRPFKAVLIGLQFKYKAQEGRLGDSS